MTFLPGNRKAMMEEVRDKSSWDWLKRDYLKKETESTIVAAQVQVLNSRNIRNVVYGENVQFICRVCGVANETVAQIVSEYSKLVQNECTQVRHCNVTKMLHWKLCKKWRFSKAEK